MKQEVKEEVEEVVEEKVNEEVEVEVVEEKVEGTGMAWLRGFLENQGAGAIMNMTWDPTVLKGPQGLDTPLLLPPESPVWTLPFVMHRVHHRILGQGRWVWVDERGSTQGVVWSTQDLGQTPSDCGGFRANGNGSRVCQGGMNGKVVPRSDKGLKMFEMAQFNVFTPDVKKGAARHLRFLCHCWEAMGLGGYAGS